MPGKWSLALKTAILAATIAVPQLAVAEYYLVYPEPMISDYVVYKSPHHYKKSKKSKKHHVHHVHKQVRKPQSHYSISVTYYWPICPGCACASSAPACYPNDEQLNTQAVTGGYVTFSGQPYNYKESKRRGLTDETFDQRTVDDDVMYNPNMNNQYNTY